MSDKNYKIIKTLPADAPFGHVHWLTISFLTPQKIEKTKYLDVVGFKVYDGYSTESDANDDVKKIKAKNKYHDIFPIQMGKLYPWDDISKSEQIEYDDKDLNDLEKKRRENADKLKLMREQFKNEKSNFPPSMMNSGRNTKNNAVGNRMREELYKKGKITKREYELMQEKGKSLNEIKVEATERDRLASEADEAYKTDYLDVEEKKSLKYGLISIFTPKSVGNLKEPCFKVRGIFETKDERGERLKDLQKKYPDDRIFHFKLGKWFVYTDNNNLDGDTLLKQLNYAMKCHLKAIDLEGEAFEERKKKMVQEANQESVAKKHLNKRERREARRAAAESKNKTEDMNTYTDSGPKQMKKSEYVEKVHSLREGIDNEAILDLINYLNDEELLGKFVTERDDNTPIDKSNAAVIEFN